MNNKLAAIVICLMAILALAEAQSNHGHALLPTADGGSCKFSFEINNPKSNTINITPSTIYGELPYGYDLTEAPKAFPANRPFYFSVKVPDGNYLVSIELGNAQSTTETTIRGESRRLFFERVATKKGKFITKTFVINKRNIYFDDDSVRIKPREKNKLNWDEKLTFEFNGSAPAIRSIELKRIENPVTTVFLCGNSTVVDQDSEPWASWGQMIPAFFNQHVSVANYAESGESSNSFIHAKRLAKILTLIKPGDYILVEFGHNDEKQTGEDKGAYKHFTKSLKIYIDEARKRGAIPVLLTPTQRRQFENGKIKDTHGEFPQAVRNLAQKENVPVIDLTELTTNLYLALGEEESKKALVHYPKGTFPGQTKDFADNTHFNAYGAYQVAQCVIKGLIDNKIVLSKSIRKSVNKRYDPYHPDRPETFRWESSPFVEIQKPDGN